MVSAQKANLAGPIVRIDGEHMLNCKCDHNHLLTILGRLVPHQKQIGDRCSATSRSPGDCLRSKASREAAATARHRQQRRVDDVVNLQNGYAVFLCLFGPFCNISELMHFLFTRKKKQIGENLLTFCWNYYIIQTHKSLSLVTTTITIATI
jgi:hypothetical protein